MDDTVNVVGQDVFPSANEDLLTLGSLSSWWTETKASMSSCYTFVFLTFGLVRRVSGQTTNASCPQNSTTSFVFNSANESPW